MSEKVDLSLCVKGDHCHQRCDSVVLFDGPTPDHRCVDGDIYPYMAGGLEYTPDGKFYREMLEDYRDIVRVTRNGKVVTPAPAEPAAEGVDHFGVPQPVLNWQKAYLHLNTKCAEFVNEVERLQRELDAALAHHERNMNAIDRALGQPRHDCGCLLDDVLKRIHELKVAAARPFTPEEAARELLGDQIARAGECGHSYVIAIREDGVTTRLHGDVTYEELARAFLKDGSPCGVLSEA